MSFKTILSVCIRLLYILCTIQDFQRFQLQGCHFCDSKTALYIYKKKTCQDAQLRSTQPSSAKTAAALVMCSSSTTMRLGHFTGKDAGVLADTCWCGSGTVFLLWSLQYQNCAYLIDLAVNFVSLTYLKNKTSSSCCFTFLQSASKKMTISILSRLGEIFNAHEKH